MNTCTDVEFVLIALLRHVYIAFHVFTDTRYIDMSPSNSPNMPVSRFVVNVRVKKAGFAIPQKSFESTLIDI